MRARSVMLLVAMLISVGVWAQSDALIGTWKMNLTKSKYSPANLVPKSGTTNIETASGGIRLVTDGVDAQGQSTHTEYTAKFDGKDYPVTGTVGGRPNPNQDAVTWRKIDDYTYENTAKLKGQALTTTHVVVSRDGKTRTNTVTGKNAQEQMTNNTVVFERQ